MKLFKKLMAAALVGAMALTMLTGCGSTINKKEIIAVMEDKIGGTITLTEENTDKADKIISIIQKEYEATDKDQKADFKPVYAVRKEGAKAAKEALGIKEDTKGVCIVSIAKVTKPTSQYDKKYNTMEMLEKSDMVPLLSSLSGTPSNNGTVSMNTTKVGETEYLVMVVRIDP